MRSRFPKLGHRAPRCPRGRLVLQVRFGAEDRVSPTGTYITPERVQVFTETALSKRFEAGWCVDVGTAGQSLRRSFGFGVDFPG